MNSEPHLEHQTLKVKQLVEDYRTGRIVIPEFQREYVWRRSKAPRLVDSLYRGFPSLQPGPIRHILGEGSNDRLAFVSN